MRVFPERLTNEEYVERVRRSHLWRRGLRPYLVVLLSICLAVEICCSILTIQTLFGLANEANQQGLPIVAGFLLGLPIGIGLGITGIATIHQLFLAIWAPRSERLLVELFDADSSGG